MFAPPRRLHDPCNRAVHMNGPVLQTRRSLRDAAPAAKKLAQCLRAPPLGLGFSVAPAARTYLVATFVCEGPRAELADGRPGRRQCAGRAGQRTAAPARRFARGPPQTAVTAQARQISRQPWPVFIVRASMWLRGKADVTLAAADGALIGRRCGARSCGPGSVVGPALGARSARRQPTGQEGAKG